MLWVFATLACGSSDSPEHESAVGSGDDTATDETCGNGRDDNANGKPDGCDWSGELTLDGTRLYSSTSGMGTTIAVCDANGDGISDVVTSDPYDSVYIFYGPILDDRSPKDADYTLTAPDEQSWIGVAVDCRDDVDGDGLADIVVGDPGPTFRGGVPGVVYVVPGGGTGTQPITDEATSTWVGSDLKYRLGAQVVAIDADGDDKDELAVAIDPPDQGMHQFGIAYLFDDAGRGKLDADAAAVAHVYGTDGDRIGDAVGNAGDLDGDGLEELVTTGNDPISAELLIFAAPLVGPIAKADRDVRIVGDPPATVSWSGIGHADLDADGRDDLLAANSSLEAGEVYAFFAPIGDDTNVADAEMQIVGVPGAGSDVTSPGDIDGDGTADLLVGSAPYDVVYLEYGEGRGVYDLADAQAAWRHKGFIEDTALIGTAIAAADVTGDGIGEFLIGAPGDGSITIVPEFNL
jgi:hypothetical protein